MKVRQPAVLVNFTLSYDFSRFVSSSIVEPAKAVSSAKNVAVFMAAGFSATAVATNWC
jgi:hypothetical protein